MPNLQEQINVINEQTRKQIEQVKLNKKYIFNFMELYKEKSLSFPLKLIYNAEYIFKDYSIHTKVKTIEEAMKIFEAVKEYSIELHQLKNWAGIYPKDFLTKNKESQRKLFNNYFYKVDKFSLQYNQNESLNFYIKYNGLIYDFRIEIETHLFYYDFKYTSNKPTEKNISCSSIFPSNFDYFNNMFKEHEYIKIWSHNNINDFIIG